MGFHPDPYHPSNFDPIGPSDEELFPEVHKPQWGPFSSAVAFQEHEERFDLQKLACQQTIPRGLSEVVRRQFESAVDESITHHVQATMMGKRIPPHEVTESRPFSIDVPASTWQMFKQVHEGSRWLRWLVRRRPVRTRRVTHTATLTATWDQFVGFPWQQAVSRLDDHAHMFGPAVRFASLHRNMDVTRDAP